MSIVTLLGCGHIHTPGFVDRLTKRDDITVSLVWDHDAKRAGKHAEALGATVADTPEACYAGDADGVIVCTETDRHEEFVVPAAAAGKHLFVEKPLGLGRADSEAMAKAIEDAGVIFQTGFFMRSQPHHRFLKQAIDAGHFGKVTRMRHSNCHSGALGDWFATEWRWMAEPARAGCGGFGDLGFHSLDILHWLGGPVTKATASIDQAIARYEGCDEYGEGVLKFENGIVGTVAAGWVDVANPVQVEVCGTEGHAWMVGGNLHFKSEHVDGADGAEPWTELPEALPHAFELFLDALKGGDQDVLIKVREAAHVSSVVEALYQGHAEGTWVEVATG